MLSSTNFCALVLPLALSQPATPSVTPTPSLSPAVSASPSPFPLYCPDSVCQRYIFDVSATSWQYWDVPTSPDYSYIWVNLWGSGGIPLDACENDGTLNYGAFISGALPVIAEEQLRVIVGGHSASEISGCGGADFLDPGMNAGGRSSIQRLTGGKWVDVATAGGGGGNCDGGNAGSGLSGSGGSGGSAGGSSANQGGACTVGTRGCGSNSGSMGGSGGGGWCGGTAAVSGCGGAVYTCGGGGGSSFTSELFCVYGADMLIGNFFQTPIAGDGAGVGSGPGGAGSGAAGRVIISALPLGWQPCAPIYPSSSSSQTLSATPAATSVATPSPTPFATPSATPSVFSPGIIIPSATPSVFSPGIIIAAVGSSLCILSLLALWFLRATLCGGCNSHAVAGPELEPPPFAGPGSEDLSQGLLSKSSSLQGPQGPGPEFELRERNGPTFMAT